MVVIFVFLLIVKVYDQLFSLMERIFYRDKQFKKYFQKYKLPALSKVAAQIPKRELLIKEEMINYFNCYQLTGLFPRIISIIFKTVGGEIAEPRTTKKLTNRIKLDVVKIVLGIDLF